MLYGKRVRNTIFFLKLQFKICWLNQLIYLMIFFADYWLFFLKKLKLYDVWLTFCTFISRPISNQEDIITEKTAFMFYNQRDERDTLHK